MQSTPGQMFSVSLEALVSSQPHRVPIHQGLNYLVPEKGRKPFSKKDENIWGWAPLLRRYASQISLGTEEILDQASFTQRPKRQDPRVLSLRGECSGPNIRT